MNNNQAVCKTEEFVDEDHNYIERFTNGSIQVNPETCIVYFEPGKTYKFKIEFKNETTRIQTIQIQLLESNEFKIPDLFTVEIYPRGLWKLPVTFMSRSVEEFKSYLKVKNPTGRGNLAVVLKALPKIQCSCLPKTINFGNVDIGMSVTRKFSLTPESNPYQFHIFIPHSLQGLNVNPTCGEVSTDSPTVITIVYTPRTFITLSNDLVVYLKRGDRKPRVITLTAFTRPETVLKITNFQAVNKNQKEFHYSPPSNNTQRENVKNSIKPINRLTLNKMLLEKCALDDIHYAWHNPLGESDIVYRDAYKKKCKDFIMNAKRFGDVHKHAQFKIPRCELNPTEDQIKYIFDKRTADWKIYKDKLYSYERISCNGQLEPMGIRERSIRMNSISTCEWNFSLNPDDNWWTRNQAFNRFVNAVYIIIIKVRLLKILSIFRTLKPSDLIHLYHGHDVE